MDIYLSNNPGTWERQSGDTAMSGAGHKLDINTPGACVSSGFSLLPLLISGHNGGGRAAAAASQRTRLKMGWLPYLMTVIQYRQAGASERAGRRGRAAFFAST